jgi:hypothetical protein
MTRLLSLLGAALAVSFAADAPGPCKVEGRLAEMTIGHSQNPGELSLDPRAKMWKNAKSAWIVKDCARTLSYPKIKTEVKAFWTDTDIYFLFICPYDTLNLFLPPQKDRARRGLWDRDVVEMFLGDDWQNIRHYREYEIAPTGDWIDLAIDLDKKDEDRGWSSGWKTAARIDEAAHIWYAAARIPLSSVSSVPAKPGTRWRMNLYRIEGQGADPQRHFLCWQQTCAGKRDPNHVPENFGTLIFSK